MDKYNRDAYFSKNPVQVRVDETHVVEVDIASPE